MAVSVIYDPAYLNHNTGNHPENSRRLERILESVKSGDLGERIRMHFDNTNFGSHPERSMYDEARYPLTLATLG